MDFIGLELRELHILILIGVLIIGGVVRLILQQSNMALKLDIFKVQAEKQIVQVEKRIERQEAEAKASKKAHERELREHRREFIELIKEIRDNREQDRREFTELIKEVRENREEMRLAIMKK